jgi:hypothetical protein
VGAAAIAAMLVASGFIASPAVAATATPTPIQPPTSSEIAQVSLAGQSVAVKGSVHIFDYAGAVKAGVSASEALKFAEGMTAGGGTVVGGPSNLAVKSFALSQAIQAARSQCHGRNGHSTYWWGNQIAIDSCNTSVLINAVWAGAGLSALGGIISAATGAGAALGAIAAAVLTVGAGALGICASWGNGIYLNQLWTGQPGCWGQ